MYMDVFVCVVHVKIGRPGERTINLNFPLHLMCFKEKIHVFSGRQVLSRCVCAVAAVCVRVCVCERML